MHCLTVVTKSRCLRTALFSHPFHPLSPAFVAPPIQFRTQVTQVTPPKPLKKKQIRKLEEKARKEEEEAKKEITIDSVDWSKVDLSAITIPEATHPEPKLQYEDGRTFHKHPHSRKVYLHTLYTNLLIKHPLLLFFNIVSVDFHTIIRLRIALAPFGAHLKVIRRRIFLNALRVAEYIEATKTKPGELWDPSGLAMHAKILPRRRDVEELEMKSLLKGSQACAVYFDDFNWRPESIDPAKIAAVVRIIERTGKTPILGARFQRTVITAEQVKKLRSLPTVDKVRGELAAVLGGPAQALAGTISTPASGLAFTLEGRQKAMEDEQGGAPAAT